MTAVQNRRCASCGEATPKYRCPRCERFSCSLACVKKHKAEHDCDGVRDKTAYVPIKEFTERHLLSDYRFLEEVDRRVDNANRDEPVHRRTTSRFMSVLRSKARQSGVTLKLLPMGFTRRRQNTTQFNRKLHMLNWRVEWSFPQADAYYSDRWVLEDTVLRTALEKYVDPEKADPIVRHSLKAYCSRDWSHIHLLMREEERRANSVRYSELCADRTLKDNLAGKVIVEFPTILVVLKEQLHKYKLVGEEDTPTEESSDSSSDDESDSDTSSSSGTTDSSQSDEEERGSHGNKTVADQPEKQPPTEPVDMTTSQSEEAYNSSLGNNSLTSQSDKQPPSESIDVAISQSEEAYNSSRGNNSLTEQSDKQPPNESIDVAISQSEEAYNSSRGNNSLTEQSDKQPPNESIDVAISQSEEAYDSSQGNGTFPDQSENQPTESSTDVTTEKYEATTVPMETTDQSGKQPPGDATESTDVTTIQENNAVHLENKNVEPIEDIAGQEVTN